MPTVVALWLLPIIWLAQKIDAQRDYLDNKIGCLGERLEGKIDQTIWHQAPGRSPAPIPEETER